MRRQLIHCRKTTIVSQQGIVGPVDGKTHAGHQTAALYPSICAVSRLSDDFARALGQKALGLNRKPNGGQKHRPTHRAP
jgi:hypothetical protein